MKRLFLAIFFICIFSGCTQSATDIVEVSSGEYAYKSLYLEKNADNTINSICIPDSETAIVIGQAVFDSISDEQTKDYVKNLKMHSVFFDEEDHLWIIGFSPEIEEKEGVFYFPRTCTIIIRAEDACVLGIWTA